MEEISPNTQNDKASSGNIEISQEQNPLSTVLEYYNIYVRPFAWIYGIAVILALLAAIIYIKTATPIYSATAQLLLHEQELRAMNLNSIGDTVQQNHNFMNTQILILKSKEVLARTQKKLNNKDPRIQVKDINVKALSQTNLVEVTALATDATYAAKFANTLCEAYTDFIYQRKNKLSNTGLDLLRDQLKDVQKNRLVAIEEFFKFKQKNGIFNLDSSYEALNTQINDLNNKFFETQIQRDEIDASLADITQDKTRAITMLPYLLPQQEDSPNDLSTLQTMLLTHEMKLPGLLMQYSEMHRAVQEHRLVEKHIKKAEVQAVETSIQGLKLQRERLNKRMAYHQQKIKELEDRRAVLDRLAGEYRMREASCTAMDATITKIMNRINEVQIADATNLESFTIAKMSDATPPRMAIHPLPRKILLIAIVGGLAIAAGISFTLVSINNKITTQEQITQAFNQKVPVFGSVPLFTDSESILLQSDGTASVDEVFRDIRTSLNLSMATRNCKVLALSSALMNEGKSFTVLNLARSFAREKRRVLLMDLDLRKPELEMRLAPFLEDTKKEKGISNVLVGDCHLKDAITSLPKLGLDVVVTGPIPPNPNELLGNSNFDKMLEEAKSMYDLVLIDTPPMLPVSDTMVILSHGIPFLLVSRLFYLTRPDLQVLLRRMSQGSITPVGIIVNMMDQQHNHHYGYSRYSGSKYGYGYGGYGYGGYGYGYGHSSRYGYGYGSKYGYGYRHQHKSKKDDAGADTKKTDKAPPAGDK